MRTGYLLWKDHAPSSQCTLYTGEQHNLEHKEDPEFSIGNLILGLYLPGKMNTFLKFNFIHIHNTTYTGMPVLTVCIATRL